MVSDVMDAIKEAMIREEDTGKYNPALNPYRSRADALAALLRMKSCHARPGQSVGECVDLGECQCSCGLLIHAE